MEGKAVLVYTWHGHKLPGKIRDNETAKHVVVINTPDIPDKIDEFDVIVIVTGFCGNIPKTAEFVKRLDKKFSGPIIALQKTSVNLDLMILQASGCNFGYEYEDELIEELKKIISLSRV